MMLRLSIRFPMNKRLPFIKLTNGKYTYSKINKKVDKNGEYYKKLKIDSNATYQQIKKSYLELSKVYHPDLQKGKQSKYNQIRQAFDILSNQALRKQYDQMAMVKDTNNQNVGGSDSDKQYKKFAKEQQEQEQYGSHHGAKQYYYHSQAQWNKTRMGLNQSSYVGVYSKIFKNDGAGADENIDHYYYKKAQMQKQNLKQRKGNQKENDKTRKELELKYQLKAQQLRQKHLERISKLENDLKQKNSDKFNRTVIGRLFNKVKNIFGKKQIHEQK